MDSSSPAVINRWRRQRLRDLVQRVNQIQREIDSISGQPSSPARIPDWILREPESIRRYLGTRTHAQEEGFCGGFCVVCQSHFSGGENIATLECRHQYHAPCIGTWLLRKNKCPVCRQPAIQEFE